MNKAELRAKLHELIITIDNLKSNYDACQKAGVPANLTEIVKIEEVIALKEKFQRLLRENPTDSVATVSAALERELLDDEERLVGSKESTYKKFIAALKEQAKAPTCPEPWKKDNQLNHAQAQFDEFAKNGWFNNGYNTILQNIEDDPTDEEASEEFAKIFLNYIKARSKVLARVDQIKEAYQPILEYRKLVDNQKRKDLDQINELLHGLKHEHGVDIENTPPYAGLMKEASTAVGALASLLTVPTGSDLVVTYKKFALPKTACNEELAKLSQVKEQLGILVEAKVSEKNREQELDSLRVKRPARKFQTVDDGLRIIRENHKKYLEENMLTQLDSLSKGKIKGEKVKQIKTYAEALVGYGQKKTTQDYLTGAIAQLSTLAKLGGGALAALLGVGVGGATFLTSKSGFLTGMINPFAGVQNVLTGAASAGLGAGVGLITYNLWKKSYQGEAAPDFETFQAEMRKAGLGEKYDALAGNIVKLFHLREGLLLGLENSLTHTSMREEFAKTLPEGSKIDDEALNTAIEVYFLQQLNDVFNEAFKDIYKIKEEEIQQELNQYKIVTWFKSCFEDPAKRQEFTQQLQIEFMTQSMLFLQHQMNEPGFLAAYPAFTATVGGLIAATVVLGVAAAVVGGPITLGILSIALVAAAVTAVASYFAVTKIDSLHYKRDAKNRQAIEETIDIVEHEIERLEQVIQKVKETTKEDVAELGNYQAETFLDSVKAIVGNLPGLAAKPNYAAVGSSDSWFREQASRYRHSKQSEIDLAENHRRIIAKAMDQTELMQDSLLGSGDELRGFISDTTAYLNDEKNQGFIKKFELNAKIRQQVLEIVAIVPVSMGALPPYLVDFYTGQLGGSVQDLELARKLAPVVKKDLRQNDKNHPLTVVLKAAYDFNSELIAKDNPHILTGDATYRAILGLKVDSEEDRIENKINGGNVQEYLDSSYEFLLSLLKHDEKATLETPYQLSEAFIVYRTLLIKQLASLADPNNQHVKKGVRSAVEKFVKEKLHLDPQVVFNNALNQALFVDASGDKQMINPGNVACSVTAVTDVSKAILTDLAYDSIQAYNPRTTLTPSLLIRDEAEEFLTRTANRGAMFAYANAEEVLRAQGTREFAKEIEETIARTREFIDEIAEKGTLVESGARDIYIRGVLDHITKIQGQIAIAISSGKGSKDALETAKADLKAFVSELNNPQQAQKVEKTPVVAVSAAKREESDSLDDFIKDVQKLINDLRGQVRNLSRERVSGLFDQAALNAVKGKIHAAVLLENGLKAAQNGRLDTSFLATEAYTGHVVGDLEGVISRNLGNMGYKNLQAMFDDLATAPVKEP
ncbi:hypothetical protein [Legionella feeleii]|uniref:Uncharacterized protein n=1 Tax=Legionella feeleii TaxID=453 RepID=A0A0W0TIA0_9GAMM|nr:hypothetical protein [Legionella feeleii]KTC95315.1 hypothetical protein Lfee_2979 [Legionella feeleii]SPX61173.1 Uncharacterised protein [Legionella feeleii]